VLLAPPARFPRVPCETSRLDNLCIIGYHMIIPGQVVRDFLKGFVEKSVYAGVIHGII